MGLVEPDPRIGIISAAYYLPPTIKAVQDCFRDEDISDEPLAADVDFQKDIGIESVHCAAEETAASLGVEASRRALEQAGVGAGDIDVIIDYTSVPEDYVAPTWSAAGIVQHELGATRAFATALNTGGCASYHLALKAACAMLSSNEHMEHALLFAGDKVPELNHVYYPITVICDGGSAVVLKKNADRGVILAVEAATVGSLHDVWLVPGIQHRESWLDPASAGVCRWLHMHSNMEKFNKNVIPINLFMFRRVMQGAAKKAGVALEDIDYFIYPTFSTWDLKTFREGFNIPEEKMYTSGLARHGHLQETDMVLNYADAVAEGLIREGDIVMATTNGAGFTWGASVIRH